MIPSRFLVSGTLLSKEKWDTAARYLPHKKEVPFRSPQEIATALLENPGRFHSPLSFQEKLQLKLFSASEPLDFFHLSQNFFYGYSKEVIPYSWQVLLRYLYRKKIITSSAINFQRFFHDRFKNISLGILSATKRSRTEGPRKGNGHDATLELALSKAIGEILERSFLAEIRIDKRGSVRGLLRRGKKLVSPATLSQFSAQQKEGNPRLLFDQTSVFSWVKGKELLSQEEVYIPAQSIFLGYQQIAQEPILREPTSNGAAGHFTPEEAILAGIYESVERDGFLIYWLNKLAPPVIDIAEIENAELVGAVQRMERYGFKVFFLNTTTDLGIPSCICVLVEKAPEGNAKVSLAGGCGWNIEEMLLGSLYEASSAESGFSQDPLFILPEGYLPFSSKILGRKERMLLWRNPEMFPKFQFFLQGKKQALQEAFPHLPTFSSLEEEYRHTMGIFRSFGKGYEVFSYQVKSSVLNKIGYCVARVLVPELLHLYLSEAYPPLGASRLKTVPTKLGYTPAEEWNPWPHPFP